MSSPLPAALGPFIASLGPSPETRLATILSGREPGPAADAQRLQEAFAAAVEGVFLGALDRGWPIALTPGERALVDEGNPGAVAHPPELVEGAGSWRVYTLSEWVRQQVEQGEALGGAELARQEILFRDYEPHAARLISHLAALRPLLAQIPGVTHAALDAFASGRLDRHLYTLRAAGQGKGVEVSQLAAVRSKLLAELRRRATAGRERSHLAAIALLDQEEPSPPAGARAPGPPAASSEARGERIRLELRAMGSRMRLGLSDAGLDRLFSWSVPWSRTLSKAKVWEAVAHIQDGDPNLPLRPDVVLLPFVGTGFYEWDHNLVGLPLRPVEDIEATLLRAVASFRLLDDSVHKRHRIVERYRTHVQGEGVREAFLRDYGEWVSRVSQGSPANLDAWTLDFFLEEFGPSPERLLLPLAWVGLQRDEIDTLRRRYQARLREAGATPRDHYEMGVLYLHCGMFRNAIESFEASLASDPLNPRYLFGLGYVLKREGRTDEARRALEGAAGAGKGGLWILYARREMESK